MQSFVGSTVDWKITSASRQQYYVVLSDKFVIRLPFEGYGNEFFSYFADSVDDEAISTVGISKTDKLSSFYSINLCAFATGLRVLYQ